MHPVSEHLNIFSKHYRMGEIDNNSRGLQYPT